MSSKKDYSKKILRILGRKSAVPFSLFHDLGAKLPSGKYAINRSIKNLKEAGLIEQISSPQNEYVRLTQEGKKKVHRLELDSDTALLNTAWDGCWRIIILDLPEERKSEREALRYLLKKANFTCVKNTVWISPHPYENLFENIKKDLDLSTELMIIVTDKLDEETQKAFLQNLRDN